MQDRLYAVLSQAGADRLAPKLPDGARTLEGKDGKDGNILVAMTPARDLSAPKKMTLLRDGQRCVASADRETEIYVRCPENHGKPTEPGFVVWRAFELNGCDGSFQAAYAIDGEHRDAVLRPMPKKKISQLSRRAKLDPATGITASFVAKGVEYFAADDSTGFTVIRRVDRPAEALWEILSVNVYDCND